MTSTPKEPTSEERRRGWLHFIRTVVRLERIERGEPIIRIEPRNEQGPR